MGARTFSSCFSSSLVSAAAEAAPPPAADAAEAPPPPDGTCKGSESTMSARSTYVHSWARTEANLLEPSAISYGTLH